MLRRRDVVPLLVGSGVALAQQGPIRYRTYSRCLPDYLRALAGAAYERRRRALAGLTTPRAIETRQRWVRETFWRLIGGEPARTPLQTRTVGAFERPGYRVETLVFESQPGLHVPANLYVPTTGRPPHPGVLFQMGHSLEGKAYETYQRCCQGLARLGFVVLGFDPMGQGQRVYYPDATGARTRLDSADAEHTLPGQQMLLHGDTSSRLQLWDSVRALDMLAAHPLVDAKRLATAGQSGGATLSMMLAAVDDRLAAAALSCGNMENFACAGFDPPGSTDDAEQNFVGAGPLGFDRWDLLYPLAPKPLLVLVSARDFFGTYSPRYLDSGREEFEHLRRAYARLGRPGHLAWAETPLPHGLAYYPRLRIYQWLRRHLQPGLPPVIQEPETTVETAETLRATRSGSVVRDLRGETPFRLNQRVPAREAGAWQELLHVERPAAARAVRLAAVPSQGVTVEAIEVASAPGVFVPAWLYLPKRADPSRPLLLVLEPQGRSSRWAEGGLYQQLAEAGAVVCAADVRGIGDLVPEFGRGSPRYTAPHQAEDHYAWASLMLGRPLAGQRVTDILALVSALRTYPSTVGRPVRLAAAGKMTVPALFAAAMETGIGSLHLSGGLVSFRSVVEAEEPTHPFANVVPRLPLRADLPEIVRALAPRPVTLAGMVDANGRKVERVPDGGGHVRVLAKEAWDAASLLS